MTQIPALILKLCHLWLLLCKYADLLYRMMAKLGDGGHEERQELVSSQVDKYIMCVRSVSSVICVSCVRSVSSVGCVSSVSNFMQIKMSWDAGTLRQ